MKIRIYLAMAAAALLMSNCSQEEALNQVQGGTNTLTAIIENGSRSAVTDGGVFSWTAGDKISVYNGTGFTEFTLSSGNVFSSSESITPSGVAIYPAGNHSYVGGTTKVNLATEYNYGSTNAPMVAAVTNTTLAFKHVGGLMRFIVKGMPDTATSFTFTANTGITGDFEVSEGKIVSNSENGKSVTINFTTEQYSKESMTFYIPLPTGTYEGYTVSIGEDQNMSNVSDASVKNTVARGTLLLMPTFTYDETNGLSKSTDGGVVTLDGGEQTLTVSGTQAVEVDASELAGAEATLNLNYTPTGNNPTLTLSESGEETESQEESAATVSVSVPNGSTVAELDITMPSMTVELNAAENETATYTTVNALTAQNTLKIGKGVSVGTLNIKGGHIRLAGKITTAIDREGEGTDIIYIIKEEGAEISDAITTIPSNVMVVNAAEYELIKAIEKGGKVTLTADVNLSSSLWIGTDCEIDLNGHYIKNANGSTIKVKTGKTLTIGGEADGSLVESTCATGAAIWNMAGTLIINSGTYKTSAAQVAAIHCDRVNDDGTTRKGTWNLTINGGTFIGQSFTAVSLQNNRADDEKGYTDGKATINGGIFTGGGNYYDLYLANVIADITTSNCTFTNSKVYLSTQGTDVNGSSDTWGSIINGNTMNEASSGEANGLITIPEATTTGD